ncbi:MAG: DUF2255 family protein [Ignavibacteriales bacterium]|nr:DUF2255 family protein [Ignavibacteriales bacterium]
MKRRKRFPDSVLAAVEKSMVIGVRAGMKPHRIIGIWAVVVEKRVFTRSWSMKARSWFWTFLEDPRGLLTVDSRRFNIRAVHTRSERLKKAVDRAYLQKYHTPWSRKFARGLGRGKRRETTTELLPA